MSVSDISSFLCYCSSSMSLISSVLYQGLSRSVGRLYLPNTENSYWFLVITFSYSPDLRMCKALFTLSLVEFITW